MLEQYKRENCLTIKELAEQLNVSTMSVFRALHEPSKMGPKMIKAIAKLLNCSVMEVYEYYKQ